MDALDALLATAAALGLVLAAAKAHGRQLRLERTQAGHPEADFRGGNDPWVEALWRGDRIGFWTLFPALAAAALLWTFGAGAAAGTGLLAPLALRLALAFAGALFVMGVQSLWRLADRDEAGWSSGAVGSSFLWWTLVALLFGVAAGLGR